LEQDGYEPAPDTCRRPPQFRGPKGAPTAPGAATKKIVRPEKSSRGGLKKFHRSALRLATGNPTAEDRPGQLVSSARRARAGEAVGGDQKAGGF